MHKIITGGKRWCLRVQINQRLEWLPLRKKSRLRVQLGLYPKKVIPSHDNARSWENRQSYLPGFRMKSFAISFIFSVFFGSLDSHLCGLTCGKDQELKTCCENFIEASLAISWRNAVYHQFKRC